MKKIIVAVVVYNRLENVKRWVRCWKECQKENAELFIIHTGDEIEKFKAASEGAKYIHRQNQGFDIGCFQDVCRERLKDFPNDWTHLLWITDDTIPMTKDFISPFIKTLEDPRVGIAAMKISKSVAPHVRTTGFCIKKEVANKLQFPSEPVTTKQQCYLFEHRGGNNTLTNQVRRLGLSCVQVARDSVSPLWDMGYWKRLDRYEEHEQTFPSGKQKGNKVTFICTIYNSYPQIISSLICQTHNNWELILIHDGPNETGLKKLVNGDPRINYIETKERIGNWGHYYRQWALNEIRQGNLPDTDYIVITNADNYYTPVFIEYMLKGFKTHTAVATYCETMTHSYKAWQVIPCRVERGYLDSGGVIVKKDIAVEIGWRDVEAHSSDWTYFSDIAAKYSAKNFIPVKGNLFVHN